MSFGRALRKLVGLAISGVVACSLVGSDLDRFNAGSGGCPPGQERCDGLCVDPRSNPNHCGSCGNACPETEVCDDGSCADSCSGGRTDCDRACVDTNTNPLHCGGCSQFCSQAEICSNGACSSSCEADQSQCGASCVDLQTSDQHCGACDEPCSIGQMCSGGSCSAACGFGQTQCGALCVDTNSNQQHCGACDNACAVGEGCSDGACKVACPGGQTECSGLCYDLLNDDDNCGACGNQCATGEVCGNGQCALNCPTGQTACGGSCADLETSATHCGACGNACGANEECSQGSCVIACKTLLNQAIQDPWGFSWDGLERAAAAFDQAQTTCEGIGGRLPTASELYRVSAVQSATVGQTIHTNFLWSAVPSASATHIRVRLSDANVSTQADSGALNYRCVCAPPLPDAYVGGNCFGPVGQGCYGMDGEGDKYNMDMQDRAPLSKGAAIWECAFYRGHLATPIQYAEAILKGIGPGSGQWLHTADENHHQYDSLVNWTDPASWVFQYTGNSNAMSYSDTTAIRPFRCVGTNFDPGTHPATVADEWVGPRSDYKGETADTPTADWATSHDNCFARGGHLPRATELGELISQGLPNGTDSWLWTSDQNGYNGTDFLASVKKWSGVDTTHQYAYPPDLSWDYKYKSYPHRCIYYPVDTAYAGPQASDCAGGCFTVTLPGSSGAKMWLDSFDRAPPATVLAAIDVCRQAGGHLASERDLTEAIRQGLPNGTNQHLQTSDVENGTQGSILVGVVRWTGTETTFPDLYGGTPNYATWGWPYEAKPFRCMWTNELR